MHAWGVQSKAFDYSCQRYVLSCWAHIPCRLKLGCLLALRSPRAAVELGKVSGCDAGACPGPRPGSHWLSQRRTPICLQASLKPMHVARSKKIIDTMEAITGLT